MAKSKEVAILFDASHCTGCKGCQVACKQWNGLPAPTGLNSVPFTGSYQSPADLNGDTRLIMTFAEHESGNKFQPLNFAIGRRSCFHCTDAACVEICSSGALYKTDRAWWRLIPTSATAALIASRLVPLTCRVFVRRTSASTSARCVWIVSKRAASRLASRPASPRRFASDRARK